MIMISSLIHNRSYILPTFLQYIANLEYDKSQLRLLFIVNDCEDNSYEILNDWRKKNKKEYKSIKIEIQNFGITDTRINRSGVFNKLAVLRNLQLQRAREYNVDYMFNIDSDIFIASEALNLLLAADKKYVSLLVENSILSRPNANYEHKQFNIFKVESGEYHYYMDPPRDQLIEVAISGACMLISKDLFKYKYSNHPHGEDVGFAEDMLTHGEKQYCITNPNLTKHIHFIMQDKCRTCRNKCYELPGNVNGVRFITGRPKYFNKTFPTLEFCINYKGE